MWVYADLHRGLFLRGGGFHEKIRINQSDSFMLIRLFNCNDLILWGSMWVYTDLHRFLVTIDLRVMVAELEV